MSFADEAFGAVVLPFCMLSGLACFAPPTMLGDPAECAGAAGGVLGGYKDCPKLVKFRIGQKVLVI